MNHYAIARSLLSKCIAAKHLRHKLPQDEMLQVAIVAVLEHGSGSVEGTIMQHLTRSLRAAAAAAEGRAYITRRYFVRGKAPAGPCVNHPERPGARIIDGVRYCHSCGVVIKRRMKKSGSAK